MKGQLFLMTILVVVSFIKYSELKVAKSFFLCKQVFCFLQHVIENKQETSLYQIFPFVHFLPLFKKKTRHD